MKEEKRNKTLSIIIVIGFPCLIILLVILIFPELITSQKYQEGWICFKWNVSESNTTLSLVDINFLEEKCKEMNYQPNSSCLFENTDEYIAWMTSTLHPDGNIETVDKYINKEKDCVMWIKARELKE